MPLTTTQWRLLVAHVKKNDGCSAVIYPCHLHLQCVLDQPVCSMLYVAIVDRPDSQFVYTCAFFNDILWPEVRSHSENSHICL